jgi:hypothetical protein
MGVPKICIIILGNPQDGFSYLGPFTSEHDAVVWAEQNRHDDLWWVTELDAPRNLRRPTKGAKRNDRPNSSASE